MHVKSILREREGQGVLTLMYRSATRRVLLTMVVEKEQKLLIYIKLPVLRVLIGKHNGELTGRMAYAALKSSRTINFLITRKPSNSLHFTFALIILAFINHIVLLYQ